MDQTTNSDLEYAYSKLGEIVLSGAVIEKKFGYLVIYPNNYRSDRPIRMGEEVATAYLGNRRKGWVAEWWPRQSAPPIVKYEELEELVEWLKPLIKSRMK